MTPAAIIKRATAEGVVLALSPAGTIKATGEGAAVNRWLPIIRQHKPEIVAALQDAANDALDDPVMEARRQRVLALLERDPGARLALVEGDSDQAGYIVLSVAIRGVGTADLLVSRERYDALKILELLDRDAERNRVLH